MATRGRGATVRRATMSSTRKREMTLPFRAMNTDVLAIVAVEHDRASEAEIALGRVEALFSEVEAALSRFRPESELSRLNRSAGKPFRASPLLFDAVDLALRAAQETEGVFDPTILNALVGAGYDRSFEQLAERVTDQAPAPSERSAATWRDVRLDRGWRLIHLPAGCGIDLGGIGKGWTVDRACQLLRPFGSFALDAGGDLFAAGAQADGNAWTVAVDDPRETGADLRVLRVRDRAVATSTIARRRWVQDGKARHHLIDPRTGSPAAGDVLSATVVADSVARAETLAKVALILGRVEGRRFLDKQTAAAGLLALGDGQIELTGGFEELCNVS